MSTLILQKGDCVTFKTKEAMIAEYGVNERGYIQCAGTFPDKMWEMVDTTAEYIVEDVNYDYDDDEDNQAGIIFLEGMEECPFLFTSDMFVLKDFEENPLFPGFELKKPLHVSVNGRFSSVNDHVKALFESLTLPLADKSYLETDKYQRHAGSNITWQVSLKRSGDIYHELGNGLYKVTFMKVKELKESDNYLFKKEDNYVIFRCNANYVVTYLEWNNDIVFDAYYAIAEIEGAPIVYQPGTSVEEYLDACDAYAEDARVFLEAAKRERDLEIVCESLKQKQKQRLENQITDFRNQIERYNENIRQTSLLKREAEKNLLYFEHTYKETDEFCQLILTAKNIDKVYIDGNYINITVTQPLMFWEDEQYEDNKNGSTYRNADKWKRDLLDKIFEDKEIELILHQTFCFHTSEARVETNQGYVGTKGIPNPHHFYFNCWGDNKSPIQEAIAEGDYATALNQAIAATAAFNLGDGTVWGKFIQVELRDMQETECLKIKETGEIISIKEFRKRWGEAR